MPDPMFDPAVVAKAVKAASKPINFAFGIDKPVLGVDRTKNGEAIAALAKQKGEFQRGFSGEVQFKNNEAVFVILKGSGQTKPLEDWCRKNGISKASVMTKAEQEAESQENENEDVDDNEDADSFFGAEQIKKSLRISKNRDMQFAFGIASDKTKNRLALHPRFKVDKLEQMIRKDVGAARFTVGSVKLEGVVAKFTCDDKPAAGLKKAILAMFKGWKLPFKAMILTAEGEIDSNVEDGDDDDAQAADGQNGDNQDDAQDANGQAAEAPNANDAAAAARPAEPPAEAVPTFSDPEIMKMIRDQGSSWSNVKKEYLKTPATMKQIVAFRKRYVDNLLRELNAKTQNRLIGKSVGTTALTSDYDITISSKDGSGIEIGAIRAFNTQVKTDFGVPPGVCFDTNLYAKDFMEVKDKLMQPEKGEQGDKDDGNIAEVMEMLTMDRSSQDVGALVKQRQYMPAEAWAEYVDGVLAGLTGPALEQTRTQFEEADSLYLMGSIEKVEKAIKVYQASAAAKGAKSEEDKKLDTLIGEWEAGRADHSVEGQMKMQSLIDEVLEGFHKHGDAYSLEANNDLYLDKIQAVREVQTKRKKIADAALTVGNGLQLDGAVAMLRDNGITPTPAEIENMTATPNNIPTIVSTLLKAKDDALRVQAKKQVADANYFASEAYLSEGPLAHIVAGKQGGDSSVLEKLQPVHLLESNNEQYGDFLKDVGHYKGQEARSFTQTSKYLARMLEAILMLRSKKGFETIEIEALDFNQISTMKTAIEKELLPIRNAEKPWDTKTDEERYAAGEAAAKKIFGVTDMKGLTTLFNQINTQINVAMRKAQAQTTAMRADDDENRSYSRMREAQPEDRLDARAAAKARIDDLKASLTRAKGMIDAALAQAPDELRAEIEAGIKSFQSAADGMDVDAARAALNAVAAMVKPAPAASNAAAAANG